MHALYSLAILVFAIVASPWFLYQAIRYRKYIGSLTQRMGVLPVSLNLDADESIWIHAVSVGEALVARSLLPALREQYPGLKIFVSTTTLTGQQIARGLPHVDAVFFFPFDLPPFVNRTLRIVKPRLFIMMETEIWPNLLRACRTRGIKTMLVNGRISSRSYPRYKLARAFFRGVLADVDRFCMQSDESARRLIDIGADPARVTVTGSLKFESVEPPTGVSAGRGAGRVLRYFRMSPNRLVFIAASTLKGEEAPVLKAFAAARRLHQNALLVIAPRKPERFGEAEDLARGEGYRVVRRTELPVDAEPREDIVILDTVGELAQLFQIATVVFVGGSLVDKGGHNILEPAVHGKPIIFGPYMQNFAEIAETFLTSHAAVQIGSGDELPRVLVRLAGDSVERARLGAAARALVETNRGAKPRTLDAIAGLLPPPAGRAVVRPFRVVR